ncbi:protein kinase domain-containing protein [Streptomonospora sediminis]
MRSDTWIVPGVHAPEPLYCGADSVLYRARRDPSEIPVVVKLARTQGPFEQRDEIELWRMHSAGRGIHSLLQHGITDTGRPYAVMEDCPEGDYRSIVMAQGPLSVDEAVAVGTAGAEALTAVHSRGLLHHAVAPENILRARFGPALIDFGSALPQDHPFPPVHYGEAGPEHAPPEELSGGWPGQASDVYRLASTVWTLLAGHPPFSDGPDDAVSAAAYRARILGSPPPQVPRADVPEWLQQVLVRALATDPAERVDSAADLARMLRTEQAQVPAQGPESGAPGNTGSAAPSEPPRREPLRPGPRPKNEPQPPAAAPPAAAPLPALPAEAAPAAGADGTSASGSAAPAAGPATAGTGTGTGPGTDGTVAAGFAAALGDPVPEPGAETAGESTADPQQLPPLPEPPAAESPAPPYGLSAPQNSGSAAAAPDPTASDTGFDAVPEPPYVLRSPSGGYPGSGGGAGTGGGYAPHAGADPAEPVAPAPPPLPPPVPVPAPGSPPPPDVRPRRRVRRTALYALAVAALMVAVSGAAWWASSLLPSVLPQSQQPLAGADSSAAPSGPTGDGKPAPEDTGAADAAEDAARDVAEDPGAEATQAPDAAEMAPTSVRIVRDGTISVELSWTDNSGGTATHHVVGGPVGAEEVTSMASVPLGETGIEITGLNSEAEYCFRVVAVQSTDVSAASKQVCTDRGSQDQPE